MLLHAEINRLASVRMENGIALLNSGRAEALDEAIRCFDEAIALRQTLPLADVPGFRYGLAAGWINRGDALTRLCGPANLADAVNSYTTAIGLLKDPPADDGGSFARRLAIAWINLGDALLAGGSPAVEACKAAERGLAFLAERESKELAAAEAGLKARHILCRAITLSSDKTSIEPELINKLTDAVESGLSLVQTWEKAGVTSFRPLATQFFHLGVLVYEKYQSHFLAEYLLDHWEPQWLAIAEESLERARHGLRTSDFASLATPRGIRRLEILKDLQAAQERLLALREASQIRPRDGLADEVDKLCY